MKTARPALISLLAAFQVSDGADKGECYHLRDVPFAVSVWHKLDCPLPHSPCKISALLMFFSPVSYFVIVKQLAGGLSPVCRIAIKSPLWARVGGREVIGLQPSGPSYQDLLPDSRQGGQLSVAIFLLYPKSVHHKHYNKRMSCICSATLVNTCTNRSTFARTEWSRHMNLRGSGLLLAKFALGKFKCVDFLNFLSLPSAGKVLKHRNCKVLSTLVFRIHCDR